MHLLTRTSASLTQQAAQLKENGSLKPILLVIALTILCLLIAGPNGNFPMNDDGLYAEGVKSLTNTGVFSITASNAFDFIPIQLGAAVCKIFGFSFEVLRVTTIGFHIIGITGLYLALRQLGTKAFDSALLSSVYAVNPFLINLSLTFMTDVPALALSNFAMFATLKAINKRRFGYWLLTVLLLTASMSVRQSALFLLPPILVAGLVSLKNGKDKLLFLSTFSIPVLAFICLQHWLTNASIDTSCNTGYSSKLLVSWQSLFSPWQIAETIAKGLTYIGLFLFPVSLPLIGASFFNKATAKSKTILISMLAALVAIGSPLAYMQSKGAFMPYSLNLFLPPILGNYCLLGGIPTWRFENLKNFTYFADVFAIATAFCLLSAILVKHKATAVAAANIAETQGSDRKSEQRLFLSILLACVVAALLVQLKASNLDRYYTISLGPLILVMALFWNYIQPKKLQLLSISLVVLLAGYATIAAEDVMNFARAQWQSISQLQATGVDPTHIDGGPSYDFPLGGLRFSQTYQIGIGWPESMRGRPGLRQMRWWPVLNDDYIIASMPLHGYHPVNTIRFWSALTFRRRTMYTLQADNCHEPLSFSHKISQ